MFLCFKGIIYLNFIAAVRACTVCIFALQMRTPNTCNLVVECMVRSLERWCLNPTNPTPSQLLQYSSNIGQLD